MSEGTIFNKSSKFAYADMIRPVYTIPVRQMRYPFAKCGTAPIMVQSQRADLEVSAHTKDGQNTPLH